MEDLNTVAAIRKRPGMYIGDVHDGSGLHHMVWELLSNALDQVLAGHATCVEVVLHSDGSVSVTDDGQGISTDLVDGVPFVQRVFTQLHSTPTADGHAPHLHLGLHGVGVSVVAALSEHVEVDSFRGGRQLRIGFARGEVVAPLTDVGATERKGTRVRFRHDPTVFTSLTLQPGLLEDRLRELAFLWPGLRTRFAREAVDFGPAKDLTALLDHGATDRALHHPILCSAREGVLEARVALRWHDAPLYKPDPSLLTYCNLLRTQGGSHLQGFQEGLGRALTTLDPTLNRRAWKSTLRRLQRGLHAVVAVTMLDPSYDSPTKSQLNSPEVQRFVRDLVEKHVSRVLEENDVLRALLKRRLSES